MNKFISDVYRDACVYDCFDTNYVCITVHNKGLCYLCTPYTRIDKCVLLGSLCLMHLQLM